MVQDHLGGILTNAGVSGFLQRETVVNELGESEGVGELRQVIELWRERFGDGRMVKVLKTVGGDLDEISNELQKGKEERDALRAELERLNAGTKPKWLAKSTKEAVIKRVDRLWQDLQGTDIARARLILRKLLGPAGVEVAEDGKAWKVTFEANPLTLFIGDRAESFHGSGGGI